MSWCCFLFCFLCSSISLNCSGRLVVEWVVYRWERSSVCREVSFLCHIFCFGSSVSIVSWSDEWVKLDGEVVGKGESGGWT